MKKPAAKKVPKRAAGRKSATAIAKRKPGRPAAPKGKAAFKKPANGRASRTAQANTRSKPREIDTEFIATTVSPPVKSALDLCSAENGIKRAAMMRQILVDNLTARGYY